MANSKETNKAIRARNSKYLSEYKKGKACRDCGGKYPPYVLDFDHVDPNSKRMGVARMCTQTISLATILEEISKCEIVCANCHRERTFKRRRNG